MAYRGLFIILHLQYWSNHHFIRVLAGVEIVHHRTYQSCIMKHHSHRPRPSPVVPHRPHPYPAVPYRPRPSSPLPCRPPPSPTVPHSPYLLPSTNMSHPVGPAVLPKDGSPPLRAPRTDYSQPSRPVRGSWQTPTGAPPGPRTPANTEDDSEGARRMLGLAAGKRKNASCSELGDEKASCGELRSLLGVRPLYMLVAPGPMDSQLRSPGKDATC